MSEPRTAAGKRLREQEGVLALFIGAARQPGDPDVLLDYILAIEAEAAAPSLTVERVLAAIPEDWSPFWHETPIEEADGVHSMMATFDRPAFAAAILAALTRSPEPEAATPSLTVERLLAAAKTLHADAEPREYDYLNGQAARREGWNAALDALCAALTRSPEEPA